MTAFKVKIAKSIGAQVVKLSAATDGKAVRLQAVSYGNRNPQQHLRILDADGDPCVFPIPGQHDQPKPVSLETPVTVQTPVYYFDGDPAGGHEVIVWGEME